MTDPSSPDDRSDEEFAAWNERMAVRYDIDRYYSRSHALVRWIESRRIRALVRFAGAGPGDAVLEVGCGAGHVLQHFAGSRRVGVDLSPTMLGKARGRLGPAVGLLRGYAEALPIAERTFDVVLCTEVLEHVPEPREVLRELARVARTDARIVVSVPNDVMIDRVKRFLRRVPLARRALRTLAAEGNEWHLHEMDLRSLRQVADGILGIVAVEAVPSRLVPVRWIVSLAHPDHER